MEKSISMFNDLIHQVNLGSKTQTIRLIKPQPQNYSDLERELQNYILSKTNIKHSPLIEYILNQSIYKTGDMVLIENSQTVIEILSVQFNRVFNVSDQSLQKEGIKSQPNLVEPTKLIYFDYLTEKYNLNTIKASYHSLMTKCYSSTILKNNPFVFIYEFKVVKI